MFILHPPTSIARSTPALRKLGVIQEKKGKTVAVDPWDTTEVHLAVQRRSGIISNSQGFKRVMLKIIENPQSVAGNMWQLKECKVGDAENLEPPFYHLDLWP